MEDQRRLKAERIFQEAVELDDKKRSALIADRCADDVPLRREVERLLKCFSNARLSGFLETPPAVAVAADGSNVSRLPERIGRYRILRLLGEGGMGTVFEAEQQNPQRTVALKVIRPGLASHSLIRRFEHEAQVLGQLSHPGIAHIYEAGVAELEEPGCPPAVRPFFAMELIKGDSLTRFAARHALDVRQRLELISRVCDAVQHAHQKGVIHRDLKPANILVVDAGAEVVPSTGGGATTSASRGTRETLVAGQPKILDFGVARAIDGDMQAVTLQTDVGQLVGTVQYMSPEQVLGDSRLLDTRSDVYALGVIAYELLCGKPPYDLQGRSIAAAARVIREEDATRLSLVAGELRGDVETIVAKSLEKDPARRYASAAELAADLRRFLHDELIMARPSSTLYQLRKYAARHPGRVYGTAATLLVLILGLAGMTWLAVRENQQRQLAESERTRARDAEQAAEERREAAEAVTSFLTETIASINPQQARGRDVTVREMLDDAARRVDGAFPGQALVEATLRTTFGSAYGALDLFADAEPQLRRAIEIRTAALGEDSLDTIESRQALAYVLLRKRAFDEALALAESVAAARARLQGSNHPDVVTALMLAGDVRHEMRNYGAAEDAYRQALAISSAAHGEDHIDTAACLSGLATVLFDRGDQQEGLALHRRVLELKRRLLADDDPRLAQTLHNIAVCLEALRDYDAAAEYHAESLAILRKVYPDGHLSLADALINLAKLHLNARGDADAAEPLIVDAKEMFDRLLGPVNARSAECLHDLGTMKYYRRDYAAAERYYREALPLTRRFHPNTVNLGLSINNLAAVLESQGRYDELEALHRQARDIFADAVGERHPLTALAMHNLGEALTMQRSWVEARDLHRAALDIRRELLGEDDPMTAMSASALGGVLVEMGELDEACALLETAAQKSAAAVGKDHWLTGHALSGLGACLARRGQSAEAEAQLLDAWRMIEPGPGDQRIQKRLTLQRIVALYEQWPRPDDAAVWQSRLEEFQRGTEGAETARAAEGAEGDPAAKRADGDKGADATGGDKGADGGERHPPSPARP